MLTKKSFIEYLSKFPEDAVLSVLDDAIIKIESEFLLGFAYEDGSFDEPTPLKVPEEKREFQVGDRVERDTRFSWTRLGSKNDGTPSYQQQIFCNLEGDGEITEVEKYSVDFKTWGGSLDALGVRDYVQYKIKCDNGEGWCGGGFVLATSKQ